MALKVKQLIAELEKMPQDLIVYWAYVNEDKFETHDIPDTVELIDPCDMPDSERVYIDVNMHHTEKYVVIKPERDEWMMKS